MICYQLIFDSINGLANIGGITFVAIGGFGLMSYVVLLVQDAVQSHCIRVILSIIIFVLQYKIIFTNMGYFIYLHIMRRRIHQAYQVSYVVQACTCFVAAFICITTPWVIIACVELDNDLPPASLPPEARSKPHRVSFLPKRS